MIISLNIAPAPAPADTQVCVVIDVLRAFTTTRFLFAKGTEKIYPVDKIETALQLKTKLPGSMVVGEHKGLKLPQADWGNSPAFMSRLDKAPKSVVLVSTNGAPALLSAPKGTCTLAAGLRDLRSVFRYLKALPKDEARCVTVRVSSGGDEDILFCDLLKAMDDGTVLSNQDIQSRVYQSKAAQKFLIPDSVDFPLDDLALSATMDDDAFFIQELANDEFGPYLRRRNV